MTSPSALARLTDGLRDRGVEVQLVLCRNVLIYLSEAGRVALLEALVTALAPGGWLVLGPAEQPHAGLGLAAGPDRTCVFRRLG